MSPESCIARRAQFAAHLHDPLRAAGFVPDGPVYRRDGLTFAVHGRWFVLREPPSPLASWSLARGMGLPGLWKWVQHAAAPCRVFEIPAWTVSEQPEDDHWDESGPASLATLLDWALETQGGRVPSRWSSPAADRVSAWIPRGALTVQAHGCVRQGQLILGAGCWALRMPVLPRLPEDLPEPRRRALEALVEEAQCRWAMVRIGVPSDIRPAALVAEVDFVGAPTAELLFSAGLDVLKHVVAWLAETAGVLADPSVAIACLAPGENRITTSVERNTS